MQLQLIIQSVWAQLQNVFDDEIIALINFETQLYKWTIFINNPWYGVYIILEL